MISLSILAGGRSKRMGQDKGLMDFLGKPLILHIIQQLASLSDDPYIISNQPGDYAFTNIPVYSDIQPGLGPLGGIYTALNKAKYPCLAVVGCDMPFASLSLFDHELGIMMHSNVDVVIPSTSQGLEPLHAIYRCTTCLPVINSFIGAGNYKIIGWFPGVNTRILVPEETMLNCAGPQTFMNLNTPDEFKRAEQAFARERK